MQIVNILILLGAVAVLVLLGIFFSFLGTWVRALTAGAHVSLTTLVAMKLRRVPPKLIVDARIRLVKAGIEIQTDPLEAFFLQGGDVVSVVEAVIAASNAGFDLPFERACAMSRAGRDIVDAVRTSVNPKVIDCPDPGKGTTMLDAVAKDGIRLLVKARVTVRTNLERLVGGATEETIIARVGQGIVSAIGSSPSYKDVLENPDQISRVVLQSGLDAQTAFEIVSIDIADVSVAGVSGTREVANVGALLETERANADKNLRQAEAEGRAAMARAYEQEMRARVQEMHAKVVEAQADVPLAIAHAFREGKLGIMDFYRMQNVLADTAMRESLAEGTDREAEQTCLNLSALPLAAGGVDTIIWIVVGLIWIVAQIVSAAQKKRSPPPPPPPPTPGRPRVAPRRTMEDELREFLEGLGGVVEEHKEVVIPPRPPPRPRQTAPSPRAVRAPPQRIPVPTPLPDVEPVPAAQLPSWEQVRREVEEAMATQIRVESVAPHGGAHLQSMLVNLGHLRMPLLRVKLAAPHTMIPSRYASLLSSRDAMRKVMLSRFIIGPPKALDPGEYDLMRGVQ